MKGRKARDLIGEARAFAGQMGYHWTDNTDPSVPFDGFMYRETIVIAVKLTKLRYSPGEDFIPEKKFPDQVADLRLLPVPPWVIRELWIRTQNERMFRRFYVLPATTAEILENTKEHYRNPHYREEYWKKAPFRAELRREDPDPDEPDGGET